MSILSYLRPIEYSEGIIRKPISRVATFYPVLTRPENLSSRSLYFRPCCELGGREDFPIMTCRQALYPISRETSLMRELPLQEEVHVYAHLLHFPALYPLLHDHYERSEVQQGRNSDLRLLRSKPISRLQLLIAEGIPSLRNQSSYPLGCLRTQVRTSPRSALRATRNGSPGEWEDDRIRSGSMTLR